jgi:succinate dehydrogenase / fumarate reductase cytochrome b subunit
MDPPIVTATRPRPVFRNIHISQIAAYRLPPPGWVSILHRVSGALIFLLLPFIIWTFDASVTSQVSYDAFRAVFVGPRGVLLKLVMLALIWAYLHHFIAGLRHLWMDVSHRAVELRQGRRSAQVTLVLAVVLTIVLGWRLFF